MIGFKNIVGHEQIIAHLKNAIAADKVSHAYILDGPDRSGKMMLAESFAAALQCEDLQDKISGGTLTDSHFVEPCMQCHSCKQAINKNQPDIIYVTHEKPKIISVDDIRRQVNGDISVKPYSSRYKIYIIDEAEKMNVQAQNAILKTIEEPPAYAVIMLLTNNSDVFLQTIRSRCVSLKLNAVPDEKIRTFLMRECHVPDYQADLCVAFAQGVVGKAQALASSDEFNELKDMTMSVIRKLYGIEDYEIMDQVKELADIKDDIGEFFDMLMLWFRDVLLFKSSGDEGRLIFREYHYEIEKSAERYSYEGLENAVKAIDQARRRINANVNFELTLEMMLMEFRKV